MSNIYYHYTSIAGGYAIIKSQSVWFTDYRFLNDKKELKQGYDKFICEIPENLRSTFERAFYYHECFNHHCVLSLSRSPETLSQWRAYADDGYGVALGLREQTLNDIANIELIPCQYESHQTYGKNLVNKYLPFIEEVYAAKQKHLGENKFMDWIDEKHEMFFSLVNDLIALKNPAFIEEQEVRAIRCVKKKNISTRISGRNVIPYVEQSFWEEDDLPGRSFLIIAEIWLGPKCNELNRIGFSLASEASCIKRYDCGYR